MVKNVLTNSLAQIISKGLTATSTLIVTLLIGKYLGPSGYGDFTKVMVFVGYFYTFIDFGLNAIYVKTANEQNQLSKLKILAGLRLVLGIAFAFFAISISQLLPFDADSQTGFSPVVKAAIFIASATIVTQALLVTANAFFQKNLKYKYFAIASGLSASIMLVWSVFISLTSPSVLLYSAGYAVSGLGGVLASFFAIYFLLKKTPWPKIDLRAWTRLLKESWPIGLALITNLVYFRNDVFILASTRSSAEVGFYGLSYQFFENSLSIPIFLTNSIYPILVTASKENLVLLKEQTRFWLRWLFIFSVVALLLLFFVSFLIPLYDLRFAPAGQALRILSLGMPLFFITALLWHLAIIHDKQKFLFPIYGFGAVLNIAANILLIPRFGYLAAALTTLFSEAVILLLLLIVLLKELKND